MPASSTPIVTLLAVAFTLVATVAPLAAQTPAVHDMPSLGLPDGESIALRYGPSGGTFAIVDGSPHDEIFVYDGGEWESCLRLTSRDRVVPTVNGELILLNDGELYSYQWRFRAAPIRRTIGRIPAEESVALAMRTTKAITSIREVTGFQGRIALETGSGIYECVNGKCERRSDGALQLLGTWDNDFYLTDPRGRVRCLSSPEQVLHILPPSCRAPSPVGSDPELGIVFRKDEGLWALQVSGSEASHLSELGSCRRGETILMVGEWLLRLEAGRAVEASKLHRPLEWRAAHRTAHHRDKPARLSAGKILAYQTANRVVIKTDVGIASIEPQPSALIDLGIEQSLPSALGTHGGALVVAQPSAVSLLSYGLGGSTKAQQRYPTFDNLMRNSVPTALDSWGGRLVVGTSDARILALSPGVRPQELVNVRELGTEFTDLHVAAERLWGVFEVADAGGVGLVSIDVQGGISLYGDSTGLRQAVCAVRGSPSGAVYAASQQGDRPLQRYIESQNLWVPLPGEIARDPYDSPVTVHELAVVSDSLIYLATSQGLYIWEADRGYKPATLSQELFRADVRSVIVAGGGVWFVVSGRGAYFLAGTGLRAVVGSGHWPTASFQPRSLVEMPDGAVCVLDGGRVVRLEKPSQSDAPTYPGLAFGNNNGRSFASFAADSRSLVHHEGDSLYVHFGLPGDATSDLVASFALDGVAIRPVRVAVGVAVFEPIPPGEYGLSVRVMAPHRGHSAAAFTQPIRVLRYWWTTPSGYIIVVLLACGFFAAVAYAHGIRQRHFARALEALIAERTADLALAQRKVERASAAKSMFLANMSHEIRTPLNAVLGMTDLLFAGELRAEQASYLQAIRRGGSALHGIVGDILDFAEIDNGNVCRRDEVFEPPVLLHELAERYAEIAAEAGLDFGYAFDVPPVIKADAQKVRSIVSHLLANAVKFTPSGFVKLRARYIAAGDESGTFEFSVTDTGIGISSEDQGRIFEVFEQVDNSNTRRYGGTGLGLAIVKTYVNCLSGTVEIASTPTAGSTFTVRLPVTSAPSIVVAPSKGVEIQSGIPPLTLLVCSRQEFFRDQLATLFARRVIVEAAVTPKGRPDLYLPPAERPAILCHVMRHLEGLVAFRQNPFTQAHLRDGRPVLILGLQRELFSLRLEDGEEALAYPLEPGAEARVERVWRNLLSEAGPASASVTCESRAGSGEESGPERSGQAIGSPQDTTTPDPVHVRTATDFGSFEAANDQQVVWLEGGAPVAPRRPDPPAGAPLLHEANRRQHAPTSPEAKPAAGPSIAAPPSPFYDLASEYPLRILVAEDNAINKTLILGVLAKFGYRADWAENGRVAVERFAATPYDLILMDVHMPEVDGLEATREIRRRFVERNVTICALTANASEDGRAECIEAGMDEFMSKPLQVPKLVATLRAVTPLAVRMAATQTSPSTEPQFGSGNLVFAGPEGRRVDR